MEAASFPSCILKVNIKCCTQCQVNAKKRLEKIHGVSTVTYDTNRGLLKASGDNVRPEILIEKFAKWGKKAELISFDKDQKPKKKDISKNFCQSCACDKDSWSDHSIKCSDSKCSDSTACTDDSSSTGVTLYTRAKNGNFGSNKPNRKKGFFGLFGGKENGKKPEDITWERKSGTLSKKTWKMPMPEEQPVDDAPRGPPYYPPNMYGELMMRRPPPLPFPPPPLPPFLPPYGSMLPPPPPPYGSLYPPYGSVQLPPPPPMYGSMYPPSGYEFPQFSGPSMVNPMAKYSYGDNYM